MYSPSPPLNRDQNTSLFSSTFTASGLFTVPSSFTSASSPDASSPASAVSSCLVSLVVALSSVEFPPQPVSIPAIIVAVISDAINFLFILHPPFLSHYIVSFYPAMIVSTVLLSILSSLSSHLFLFDSISVSLFMIICFFIILSTVFRYYLYIFTVYYFYLNSITVFISTFLSSILFHLLEIVFLHNFRFFFLCKIKTGFVCPMHSQKEEAVSDL